jgi:hypothetical protein
MSARVFPLASLRPFTASELFGFALNAPSIVPADEYQAHASLLIDDIREDKLALGRALKRVKAARDGQGRAAAIADVKGLQRRLLRAYLKLQRWSIGYRFPGGELQSWPARNRLPPRAVPVVKPEGTGETGSDRPAARFSPGAES